jgi:hypothetical protein
MRSQFASLRILTLPGGATTGTRIVIDGIAGNIQFYNSADELIGFLSPDQWYTGLADGAHAQLDPFGGLRIFDENGLIVASLDSTGLDLRDPVSGAVGLSLDPSGMRIADPITGQDISIGVNSTSTPRAPRYAGQANVLPGVNLVSPAALQFTPNDLELRHVAAFTNGVNVGTSMAPPAGYAEVLDAESSSGGATIAVGIASRQPAVPNAARTFVDTSAFFQFSTGSTIVVAGAPGAPPSVRSFSSLGQTISGAGPTVPLSLAPPVGTAAGDVLLAFVSMGIDGDGFPTSWSVPEGWFFLGAKFFADTSSTPDSTLATGVWYKIATASEPSQYDVSVVVGPGIKKTHATIVAVQNAATVGAGADIRIGNESLPRGIIRQQQLTTDGAVFNADSVTDMVLTNVPVIGGRTYEIHLHTEVSFASLDVTARWILETRINGVVLDRFANLMPAVGGTTQLSVDASVFWTPTLTAETDDIDVFANELTNGADIQLRGSATSTRILTLTDVGVI